MQKLHNGIDIIEEYLPQLEILWCIWMKEAYSLGTGRLEQQRPCIHILERLVLSILCDTAAAV
jgi:hypothetical protein